MNTGLQYIDYSQVQLWPVTCLRVLHLYIAHCQYLLIGGRLPFPSVLSLRTPHATCIFMSYRVPLVKPSSKLWYYSSKREDQNGIWRNYILKNRVQDTVEGKLRAIGCDSANVEVQWNNIKECHRYSQ